MLNTASPVVSMQICYTNVRPSRISRYNKNGARDAQSSAYVRTVFGGHSSCVFISFNAYNTCCNDVLASGGIKVDIAGSLYLIPENDFEEKVFCSNRSFEVGRFYKSYGIIFYESVTFKASKNSSSCRRIQGS
jgi:hypothetical protein